MAGLPPSPQGSPGKPNLPSYEEATIQQQQPQQQMAIVPLNQQQNQRLRTSTQDSIASTGSVGSADAEAQPPTTAAGKIAKLFQDHGRDFTPEATAEIRWVVDSWADLRAQDKVLSEPVTCMGREWRILLFPNGNGRGMAMSMYLQLDWPGKKDDEAIPADFVLGIVHPEDESVSHFQYSSHRFGEVEMDWGFSAFLSMQDLPKFCQRVPVPSVASPTTASSSTDPAADTAAATPTADVPTAAVSPPTTPPATATGGAADIGPRTSSATAAAAHGFASKTILVAHVRALHDETGVLLHSFKDYNSKRVTGYVGLKNQGATCYMNSILQSLFCTNYFRKAVYQIPPPPTVGGAAGGSESGSSTDVLASSQPNSALDASSNGQAQQQQQRSVTWALQRLFYFMQTADDAVETNELTKSFGWNTVDAFAQHDVQEFLRVLSDNLEEKMKGTPADGMIQWLFVGKMKSYIKCVNVEYESARVEDFYDVQLNVKGMKTVTDSFHDYIQVEMLEGDNKYMAEGHGLQDAKKGVVFTQFPPVLHLQLKRFEYDFMRDAMVKINDRYEFPLELDLDEFLVQDGAAAPVKQKYHLHGVLVHSGSVDAGHYCAFIRPSRANKWFKFDDDKVIPVTVKEVTEDNYGGEYPGRAGARPGMGGPGAGMTRAMVHKRFTNAYMLVYIREADYDKVLCDVGEDDVPKAIRDQLEQERREREERERELREREFMLTVRVIDDSTIRAHSEFDLWNFTPTSTEWQRRLNKHEVKWKDVHAMFAAEHLGGKPADQIRFWLLTNRENKSLRPDTENLLHAEDGELTLQELRARNPNSGSPYELLVYCEVPSIPWAGADGTQLFPPSGPALAKAGLKAGTALLFVKVFDVATQTMRIVGHMHVDRNAVIKDSLPTICTLAGLPIGTKLRVFEEVHQTMQQPVNVKSTWKAEEVVDGDIIAVQVDTPAAEAGLAEAPTSPKTSNHHLDASATTPAGTTAAATAAAAVPVAGHLRTVLDYYEFLINRMDVVFKPKPPGRDNHSMTSPMSVTAPTLPPELRLTLSKKMSYDEVSARVARELGLDDPFKVRFTSTYYNDVPKAVIRRVPNALLADMVGTPPMTGFYRTQQPAAVAAAAAPAGTLLYEILPMSLVEMEQKRQLKVTCVLPTKHDEHMDVVVAKTATVKQLAQHVAEKLGTSIGGVSINPDLVRINEQLGHRLHREFEGKEPLSMVPDYVQLVAQIMPSVPAGAQVLYNMPVVHMNKLPTQLHGTPFRFPVIKGEKVATMRARLQQYLGWSDKEMGKVTPLKMVAVGAMDDVRELADDDVVADLVLVKPTVPIVSVPIAGVDAGEGEENQELSPKPAGKLPVPADDKPVINASLALALDHPVRRASRFVSGLERAVKIFN